MSKTNLSDIFSDLNTESSVILQKSIKIKNIKNLDIISDATSSFMPQKGGYSDATSSFMPQKGGYSDATSSFMPQKRGYLNGTKNKDINQLISMLSATSDDNYTANSTDTEQLKNKLFNIIQSGGTNYYYTFQDYISSIIHDSNYEINNKVAYLIQYKSLSNGERELLKEYVLRQADKIDKITLGRIMWYGLDFTNEHVRPRFITEIFTPEVDLFVKYLKDVYDNNFKIDNLIEYKQSYNKLSPDSKNVLNEYYKAYKPPIKNPWTTTQLDQIDQYGLRFEKNSKPLI